MLPVSTHTSSLPHKPNCRKSLICSPFYQFAIFKNVNSQAWWCTPSVPSCRTQREVDFWVQGQLGVHSEILSWRVVEGLSPIYMENKLEYRFKQALFYYLLLGFLYVFKLYLGKHIFLIMHLHVCSSILCPSPAPNTECTLDPSFC